MPFPITKPLTAPEFRQEIIECYWKWGDDSFQDKINNDDTCPASNKAELINDFCKIGSYLSDKAKVLQGLEKLELAIRAELEQDARGDVKDKVARFGEIRAAPAKLKNRHNEPIIFKTGKLLSGVLGREETRSGFNGLDSMTGQPVARSATLHSKANVGVKDGQGNVLKTAGGFQTVAGGRTKATPVALPSGVPGMTGGIAGMDFQRILLRHGYQWKDVGAGALDHGEYTHRLQWYAITANNTTSASLSLANTPLEIFCSMGCMFARSTFSLKVDEEVASKTFLWEAIFDCFAKQNSQSIALASAGIFNFPDHLNTELSKVSGDEDSTFKSDPKNLYCLRVLMSARRSKRFATTPDPLNRLLAPDKKVKEAFMQDGADAYLAWYVS